MRDAINNMFAAISVIFSATQKLASSVDILAGVAEAEAQGFADESTVIRQQRIADLKTKSIEST